MSFPNCEDASAVPLSVYPLTKNTQWSEPWVQEAELDPFCTSQPSEQEIGAKAQLVFK
jgi:hypothetical protein